MWMILEANQKGEDICGGMKVVFCDLRRKRWEERRIGLSGI